MSLLFKIDLSKLTRKSESIQDIFFKHRAVQKLQIYTQEIIWYPQTKR